MNIIQKSRVGYMNIYIKMKWRVAWEHLDNLLIPQNQNKGTTALTLLCKGDQQVTKIFNIYIHISGLIKRNINNNQTKALPFSLLCKDNQQVTKIFNIYLHIRLIKKYIALQIHIICNTILIKIYILFVPSPETLATITVISSFSLP